MDKILQITLPKKGRIIVVSDIHGELQLFKNLLQKVQFCEDDILVLNGDLCEKGRDSLGVVRYVMQLCSTSSNVFVIEGNCDTLLEDLLEEQEWVLHYLARRPHSIMNECYEKLGKKISNDTVIQEVKKEMINHYTPEIEWLMSLPTAIVSEDYLFVHAGVNEVDDWKKTSRYDALTLGAFLYRNHKVKQKVIVGHYPVSNYYDKEIPSYNPIVNNEKRTIAIDGGNCMKHGGQLNAFIIEKLPNGDTYSSVYVDQLEVMEVKKDYKANPLVKGNIAYPNYEIKVITKNKDFSLCKHIFNNNMLYVKNEFIQCGEDGTVNSKDDVSCSEISVKKGETVGVINASCSGFNLIKRNGKIGWVPKEIFT